MIEPRNTSETSNIDGAPLYQIVSDAGDELTDESYDSEQDDDYDESLMEETKNYSDCEGASKLRSSSPSNSVFDKLQDFVESELFGKSRAMVRHQLDSMIDNSS